MEINYLYVSYFFAKRLFIVKFKNSLILHAINRPKGSPQAKFVGWYTVLISS